MADLEVRVALWSVKPFKAPGLDGLHAGFFQRFWLLVGGSVREIVGILLWRGSGILK